MKHIPRYAKKREVERINNTWVVVEALHSAELIHICRDKADVKSAIENLVNDYGCDPEDVKVFPLSAAIPFTFTKVEAVEITL